MIHNNIIYMKYNQILARAWHGCPN